MAALLQADGVKASVVSMPCVGIFNDQPEDYRRAVLPDGVPQFGLTAGLAASMRMIAGFNGEVFAMNRFGASAPFKVLDVKFGFTADNIYDRVRSILNR